MITGCITSQMCEVWLDIIKAVLMEEEKVNGGQPLRTELHYSFSLSLFTRNSLSLNIRSTSSNTHNLPQRWKSYYTP